MGAQRGEFGGGRLLRIGGRGRRAVAIKAPDENRRGLILGERAAVEKTGVRVDGGGGGGGEFDHGEAAEHESAQGALAAGAEEAVAVADGDEAGGAVGPLEPGGFQEDRELAGAVAGRIAGAPSGAAQDRDAVDGCGGGEERDRGEAQSEKTEERRSRHRDGEAVAMPAAARGTGYEKNSDDRRDE